MQSNHTWSVTFGSHRIFRVLVVDIKGRVPKMKACNKYVFVTLDYDVRLL